MAAMDNVNPQQFFHASPHEFKPGDTLTPRGGMVAKYGEEGTAKREKLGYTDKHVYYADAGNLGESMLYGSHIYSVQPETKTGRAVTKHQPDPNYKDFGGGAYRTTGQLRVSHEVDEQGKAL